MSQSLSHRLIHKLIDWLIAFFGASLLLWFVITQPVFIDKPQDIIRSVDTKELKKHVQLLTSGFAPRTINYDNLNNTADYIYQQFATLGMPEYQKINTISHEYRNVSLQLGPDTEEMYVIGAHYDAEDDSIDTEGNASGVATLIELARNLGENNNKLQIGVILIAYPLSLNQTDNYMNTGSFFHANSLKKNKKKVRLMISLDSIGQIKSQNGSMNNSNKFMDFLYPGNESSMNIVGRLKDFNNIRELKKGFNSVSSLSLDSRNFLESFNKTHSSDHVNYWKQGYPAVLISDTTNYSSAVNLMSKIQPTDRLDYEKMGMLVNGLLQVVIQAQTKDGGNTQLAQHSRNKKAKLIIY